MILNYIFWMYTFYKYIKNYIFSKLYILNLNCIYNFELKFNFKTMQCILPIAVAEIPYLCN